MDEKIINKKFELIEKNLYQILKSQRNTLILIEKLDGEIEELRKQNFFLANAAQKLKQEIDEK